MSAAANPLLQQAAFRVVRGNPTPEELAALAGVLLLALRPAAAEPPAPARVQWDRPGPDYRSPLAWAAQAAFS